MQSTTRRIMLLLLAIQTTFLVLQHNVVQGFVLTTPLLGPTSLSSTSLVTLLNHPDHERIVSSRQSPKPPLFVTQQQQEQEQQIEDAIMIKEEKFDEVSEPLSFDDSIDEDVAIKEECEINNEDFSVLAEEMAESLDISRQTTRVESLSSYVVVSVLTGTASFETIQQVPDPPMEAQPDVFVLHQIGFLVAALSTLSGIYSTVIFSLCTTYGLAALGMGRDTLYDNFMGETQSLRMKGFQSYRLSLGLFLVELSIVTSERLSDVLRYPFLLSFSILTILAVKDWNDIVEMAGSIFANMPANTDGSPPRAPTQQQQTISRNRINGNNNGTTTTDQSTKGDR